MKILNYDEIVNRLTEARGLLEDVESGLEDFQTAAYEEGRDTGYEEGYSEGYDTGVSDTEASQEDSK